MSSHSNRMMSSLATAAILALSGCGVIFGYGQDQPVQVTTSPEGCTLEVDGTPQKELTPTTVYLHPKSEHHIVAKKKGYQPSSRTITKVLRTDVVIMDAVLTLGIGVLVDYMSGSLYRLDSGIKLNLGPVQEPTPSKTTPKPDTTKPDTTKPDTTKPDTTRPPANAKKCPVCDEPRGDVSPCPHCGVP